VRLRRLLLQEITECGKLREIEEQVRRLTALRGELAGLIACSPRQGRLEECKVFGMLEGAAETSASASPSPRRSC
jgi:hypothetical protein